MNKRTLRLLPRTAKSQFIKEIQNSTYLLIRPRPYFVPRFLYLFLIKKIINLPKNQFNQVNQLNKIK